MTEYAKYETVGGLPDESVTYSRLTEHLRLATEQAYTLGHINKSNDNELLGAGWLGIGQLLERMNAQVTQLAMKGKLIH